jgi:hypothetical protein
MSLAKRLESLRERAQRDVDALDDDTLLSSRHVAAPAELAERNYLAPVRLGRAAYDTPRQIKMAVAGEPGREAPGGAPIVVPGTRVDLVVALEGGETLAFMHEEDDQLDHAGIRPPRVRTSSSSRAWRCSKPTWNASTKRRGSSTKRSRPP